jgi:hypothetical protein
MEFGNFAQVTLDHHPPTSDFQVAGITGMHHYAWPFIGALLILLHSLLLLVLHLE